jgi:hypothetical protein
MRQNKTVFSMDKSRLCFEQKPFSLPTKAVFARDFLRFSFGHNAKVKIIQSVSVNPFYRKSRGTDTVLNTKLLEQKESSFNNNYLLKIYMHSIQSLLGKHITTGYLLRYK